MLKKYFYVGYLKNGRKKYGFIKESGKKEAEKTVRNKDIFPTKIIEIPLFYKKLKNRDIIDFFMQMRIFIKNGYSFYGGLDILEENEKFLYYIKNMKISLKKGKDIYEVFKNSGIRLRNIHLMILKAGEEAGNLEKAFEIIENDMKEREKIKQDTIKMMIYPLMIFIFLVILIFFLGFYILPDFIKLIDTNKKDIPIITKIIIFITKNFNIIILGFVLFIFVIIYIFKKYNVRKKLFQKLVKINLFKRVVDEIFTENFLNILSILLKSGISMVDAIKLVKDEIKTDYFSEKLEDIYKNLKKGKTIYFSFDNVKIFTKMDMELIKSGEETGEIINIFNLISERKKYKIKQKTEVGLKILEPLTILIIGVIVGTVFLGIYMPVFQAMDNI